MRLCAPVKRGPSSRTNSEKTMNVTRSVLLRASRSAWLADQFRRRAFARRAVRRFMPGEDLESALEAAAALKSDGIGAVLTQLGERVTTGEDALAVHEHYRTVLAAIGQRSLPAHISVKLTHLGLDVDKSICAEGLAALTAQASAIGSFVWVDMEESNYVDRTLEIFRSVRAKHDSIGICLQAYLERTPADTEALVSLNAAIRLVKGAYREPVGVALASKQGVDAAYRSIGERLLRAPRVPRGATAFGTHDLAIIEQIRSGAGALELPSDAFEVHMLYGIKSAEQRDLARQRVPVRVLVSYGTQWFPWYMRRLAERPANVWFVVRNILP
jgi:proline dehydrogenase